MFGPCDNVETNKRDHVDGNREAQEIEWIKFIGRELMGKHNDDQLAVYTEAIKGYFLFYCIRRRRRRRRRQKKKVGQITTQGLYRVSRTDRGDYDEYDSFVVICASEEEARKTHPREYVYHGRSDDNGSFWCWYDENIGQTRTYMGGMTWVNATQIHTLDVEFIGEITSNEKGVILASYNAG